MSTMTSTAATMGSALQRVVRRIEEAGFLDEPARAVAGIQRKVLGARPAHEVLSGTWLGHPLHPALTDLVIGTWTSALLLDLFGGRREAQASERLIGVGVVCALPTALSGSHDWSHEEPGSDAIRRVGAVHAVGNSVVLGLQIASLVARRRGEHRRGVTLSLTAGALTTVTSHLGGHLTYELGAAVDADAAQHR